MENPVAQTTSERNRGASRRRRRGGQRQNRPQAQTQPLDQTQQPSNQNPQPHHPLTVGARPFGGQLTRLHGDAPAFIPASLPPPSTLAAATPPGNSNRRHQKKTPAASRPHPPHTPQPRRGSIARSTAPDIVTRIHEDISHNVYECAICTNEVSRNSKIWSCKTCWTVFHIGCIKKWSKNEGSAVHRPSGQDDDEAQVGKLWRCPGCNLPKDITPTSYTYDHVPYSTTTLTMYLEDVAWAHKQEAILRVFAADDQEKRYRFQPMKNHQRAFIHSLADDFGFDGESLDPEPHRHVLLFKTPKFVSAPMKTLAQAARIKRPQLNISAPVQATKPPKPADEARYDYNGLLLERPKFGLTEDEVHRVIQKTSPTTDFDTIFLPNDQGVALLLLNRWESPPQLTALLSEMRPTIADAISKESLASSVTLAMFDLSGLEPKIVHQAGKSGANVAHGWSQVAAKRATPMQAPQIKPVGQRPIYTVLGSRLAEAKKKKQENEELLKRKVAQEEVVDDWEKEAELDEGVGDGGEGEPTTDGGFGDDSVGNGVQKV
ncbi:hypothetical protein B0A52_04467 [Exophiala mesophila]|uniref:R3H domain-containing protein n=1 Tax=Exophiala mesophila TaxID=212818 RepID=A0A438N902_EXOME|nr:hypothetical protein B0A52_04467 [Exophiala mesophila]